MENEAARREGLRRPAAAVRPHCERLYDGRTAAAEATAVDPNGIMFWPTCSLRASSYTLHSRALEIDRA